MSKKPSRNDPCPCGSGKKYKKCCLEQQRPQGSAGRSLFGRIQAASQSSGLKRKIQAKDLTRIQAPRKLDAIEKAFQTTQDDDNMAPPMPTSQEIPEAVFPENYKKWEEEEKSV